MKKEIIFKPTIYWILALYILLSFLTLALGDKVAAFSFREDHYFENVGAISLFVAAIIFFYAFRLSLSPDLSGKIFWVKKLAYLGFALLFFFGAGEEISWGQRIFNIKTPDALSAINAQDEITVHNMSFMGYQLPFENGFDVVWMTVAVLIPVLSMFVKPFERFADRLVPIVHWWVGLLFILNYGFAKVAKIIFLDFYTYSQVPYVQAVQEVKESHYELLFAFLALFVLLELKKLASEKTL